MVRNNVNYLETEFLKQCRDNKYYDWKNFNEQQSYMYYMHK